MHVPEVPAKFIPVADLGAPVAVYTMARWQAVIMIGLAVVLLLGAATTPFLAMANAVDMGNDWYAGGALLLLFACILGGLAWFRGRNTFVVYQEGFAWAKGSHMQAFRWDQVAAITSAVTKIRVNLIPAGTSHKHVLDMVTGDRLTLTDNMVAGVGNLVQQIKDNVMPRLFEQYGEAYNRGEVLEFGPLAVGRDLGIRHKGEMIPWDQVEGIGLNEGILKIAKVGGKWYSNPSVAVSQIPNFEILYSVLSQVLGFEQE